MGPEVPMILARIILGTWQQFIFGLHRSLLWIALFMENQLRALSHLHFYAKQEFVNAWTHTCFTNEAHPITS